MKNIDILIVYLLLAHWIGDWVLQPRWMAEAKSHDWNAMFMHVLTYSAVILLAVTIAVPDIAVPYTTVNGLLHLATDVGTSRLNVWLYKSGRLWLFWTTVGLDQFIHAATLIITLRYV